MVPKKFKFLQELNASEGKKKLKPGVCQSKNLFLKRHIRWFCELTDLLVRKDWKLDNEGGWTHTLTSLVYLCIPVTFYLNQDYLGFSGPQ